MLKINIGDTIICNDGTEYTCCSLADLPEDADISMVDTIFGKYGDVGNWSAWDSNGNCCVYELCILHVISNK